MTTNQDNGDPGPEGWRDWWTTPPPGELHTVRRALAEQTRTVFEHEAMAELLRRGKAHLVPGTTHGKPLSRQEQADVLLEDEYQRLTGARIYYLTAKMSAMARDRKSVV